MTFCEFCVFEVHVQVISDVWVFSLLFEIKEYPQSCLSFLRNAILELLAFHVF